MPTTRAPRRLALVGASVLGLAAVAVLLLWVNAPRESAEDAAQEYLDAIAAGDLALANELVPYPPDDSDEGTIDGRTAEAFAGAAPITAATVTDSTQTEGIAQVQVSYAVSEETVTRELTAARAQSSRWFAEDWQVTTSLALVPRLNVADIGLTYSIGELTLDRQAGDAIVLYPGSYPVTVEGGTYLAAGEQTLDVASSEAGRPRLLVDQEPTAALTDELVAYVRAAVDRCAIRSQSYVSQCQLWANRDGEGVALEPVTWTVLTPPEVVDSTGGAIELRTGLRAEYQVAEGGPNGPRHEVTEEVRLRTQLVLDLASPDAYEIADTDWHTLPSGS